MVLVRRSTFCDSVLALSMGKSMLSSKLSFNPDLKGNEQIEVSDPHDACGVVRVRFPTDMFTKPAHKAKFHMNEYNLRCTCVQIAVHKTIR